MIKMAKIFHELLTIEEALDKVFSYLKSIKPLSIEKVKVLNALGRILAEDIYANIDLPPFDRSTVDGYAVIAESLYGAEEDKPIKLKIVGESIVGKIPKNKVDLGEAIEISTGAPIPRGANSVVMVEHTKKIDNQVYIYRSISPNENISQTGSDVRVGDKILRKGCILTPREIAILASLGYERILVYKKIKVGIFSIGNELIKPGRKLLPGKIYDANSYSIYSLLFEIGAEPIYLGTLKDDYQKIKNAIINALDKCDIVITSGGTSAGLGDIVYKVFEEIGGELLVHGLKIKPGKPTVVTIVNNKLLIGLPGFPVSAMVVFNIFVKPILLKIIGVETSSFRNIVKGKMALRYYTSKGRREYVPVELVNTKNGLIVYPLLSDSGAIATFSLADGFIEIPELREFIDENEEIEVELFSKNILPAELIFIGSHCPGVDLIIDLAGLKNVKIINLGSFAGWQSIKKGEADIAGTHLLDEEKNEYNLPFLRKFDLIGKAVIVRGYSRLQGFLIQKNNPKNFKGFEDLLKPNIRLVNRNKGSGTRTLLDLNLKKIAEIKNIKFEELIKNINGYSYEVKTHSAVAAAIKQGRADVGIAVKPLAIAYDLDFIPISEEIYDFLIPIDSLEKESIKIFLKTLASNEFSNALKNLPGYNLLKNTGEIIKSF
jgi:putative molybdopterin biosynthesis protein